jgi:hypothetical protein
VLGAALLLASGCLGRPRHNATLEQITRAPGAILGLPCTGNRPYWLLRDESGWQSAHETRFGDAEGSGPTLIVRAAQFRDAVTAGRALAHLTPDTVWRTFPSGGHDAVPVAMTLSFGSAAEGARFAYTLARTATSGGTTEGYLIMARVGVVVLLLDGIGLPADEMERVLAALLAAVARDIEPNA